MKIRFARIEFEMMKFTNSLHEREYFRKTQYLLSSDTYNDLTFCCKDGNVGANRLMLALFSNFLNDVFDQTSVSLFQTQYLRNHSEIDLPNVYAKDMRCLLLIINNTSTCLELNESGVLGVKNAASQLQVDLLFECISNNVFKIYAVPKRSKEILIKTLNDEEKSSFMNNAATELKSEHDLDSDGETNCDSFNRESEVIENNKYYVLDSNDESKCDIKNVEASVKTKNNECTICNITLKSAHGLKIHIGHIHKKPKRIDKRVCKCECGKVFSRIDRNLFRFHRKQCETYREQAFICEICDSPFDSYPLLNVHLAKTHHRKSARNLCPCGMKFKNCYRYRLHAIRCDDYFKNGNS
ncbi:hypothetical protein B4U80_12986 [Leptotrombidium deliense]|uniref:C2H2-type domain-containing protein n=1 Tax=Leptotrombidium deliense TaxID=299467 RepID=A0A443SFR3_9ACAR|nr:hypothetical protein B4U80_12986 [Leptotrombidium deliense]